jgi:hypothetical protein
LAECRYYIENTGRVGNRPKAVKEMTEEEKPHLRPLPIKRYEVGVHDKATVDNQQFFKFDNRLYSAPRLYAGKEIGIIAYPYRVEFHYRGNRIWECDRPIFGDENRVNAEHYMYDLKVKPRSRENAFPLLEGILPPALHRFRELCKSKTTKCYQMYMLLQMMEEVGREKLLKAVDIANDTGSPTLKTVEQILALDFKAEADDTGAAQLDQALMDDEFYVQKRDPTEYDSLWDSSR